MNTYDYILKKFNLNLDSISSTEVQLPFTRRVLITLFKELNFKKGAEIGVGHGGFSLGLCVGIPSLKLYCIDPWTLYEGYIEPKISKEKFDIEYASTKEKLAPYNCTIIKDFSMNAIKKFSPKSLDFVYIDANHDFKHVSEDVEAWAKIVRPGGIVSGHDYKAIGGTIPDVGIVVDKYVKKHKIKNLFVFTERNDASWFFVKK